jgi:hypothetical protein
MEGNEEKGQKMRREGRQPNRIEWYHKKSRAMSLEGHLMAWCGELHMKELTKKATYILKQW